MEADRKRSQTTTIVVVALVVLAVACVACLCLAAPAIVYLRFGRVQGLPWRPGQVQATEEIEQSYEAGTPLELQLQISVGDVRIVAGESDQVVIRGTKRAWGADRAQAEARLRDYRVDIRQPSPTSVVVESQAPGAGEGRSPSVDLVIELPARSDLRAVVNVGGLHVSGLEGTLDLTTNVGELWVEEVRLSGANRLSSNVGSVTINLRPDASLELDARTSVGSVSSGVPLKNEVRDSTLVGKSLRGQLGEAPSGTLTVRVTTGDIRIQR